MKPQNLLTILFHAHRYNGIEWLHAFEGSHAHIESILCVTQLYTLCKHLSLLNYLYSSIFSPQMCVIRAWDPTKPLIYCPAMNTHMWDHPITAKHLSTLSELGYIQVPPISKLLACGDYGVCVCVCVYVCVCVCVCVCVRV